MDRSRTAQLALVLRGLLGQDVALERLTYALIDPLPNLKALAAALFLVFILGMMIPRVLFYEMGPGVLPG